MERERGACGHCENGTRQPVELIGKLCLDCFRAGEDQPDDTAERVAPIESREPVAQLLARLWGTDPEQVAPPAPVPAARRRGRPRIELPADVLETALRGGVEPAADLDGAGGAGLHRA